VLYELVTVRRLFKGNTDFLVMTSITRGDIPKPSTVRPELPAGLENIIMKALSLDPANRYQTADELRNALERFWQGTGQRTTTKSIADYMTKVFGVRPEPWIVDDEPTEAMVDFDGDISGVVHVPPDVITDPRLPSNVEVDSSSLIVRALDEVTHRGEPEAFSAAPPPEDLMKTQTRAATAPPVAIAKRSAHDDLIEQATITVEPLVFLANKRRRRRQIALLAAAAAGAVLAMGTVVLVIAGRGTKAHAVAAPLPQPDPKPAVVDKGSGSAQVAAPPVVELTPDAVTGAAVVTPQVVTKKPPVKRPQHPKKPRTDPKKTPMMPPI
jgi:hypothetical protein